MGGSSGSADGTGGVPCSIELRVNGIVSWDEVVGGGGF